MSEIMKKRIDWIIIGVASLVALWIVGVIVFNLINDDDVIKNGIEDGYRITTPYGVEKTIGLD